MSERTILPDCMLPDGADPCAGYQQLYAQVESLRSRLAEAEALRKDAERYRWLRIPENGVSVTIADEDDPETWYEYDSLRLDAAIDAAMEQSHDK